MIAEDVLERGLSGAADRYEVPPDAIADLQERLGPAEPQQRRRLPVDQPKFWWLTAAAGVVALVAIAIAVGGGSGNPGGNTTSSASAGSSVPVTPQPAPAVAGGGAVAVGGGTTGEAARGAAGGTYGSSQSSKSAAADALSLPAQPAASGAKIVKTGEMDLQVGKGQVASTLNQVTGIATLVRGYVAESHSDEGSDPSGSVTLRVPASSFEATVQRVRALDVKVTSQQLAGADVTSKYVDLQARVRALQDTRTTFERLLSRATTIGDTLAIQNRINDVQTQIEQLQGQINLIDDQADYGTLTVTVDQKIAPAPVPHHQSGMSRAIHRSVDRFVNGIEAIIGILGPLLLVLLVAAFAVVVGRLGYRRLRRELV
jgi:hypothetical protein